MSIHFELLTEFDGNEEEAVERAWQDAHVWQEQRERHYGEIWVPFRVEIKGE
jgi:hypothetical protein